MFLFLVREGLLVEGIFGPLFSVGFLGFFLAVVREVLGITWDGLRLTISTVRGFGGNAHISVTQRFQGVK